MARTTPALHSIDYLRSSQLESTLKCINGKWVPARPTGYPSWRNRFKHAWLVFTGKADAVFWPDQ